MTGIIIVTHGPLAKALVESSELIIGKASNIQSIGLFHGDNVEDLKSNIEQAIDNNKDCDGNIMLSDLFGGTPNNQVARIINQMGKNVNIKCFVGVNLPILLEAITSRESMSFLEIVEYIKRIAKDTIFELGEKLTL